MTNETALTTTNPFAMMDAMDDENIIARLQGRVSKAWVYSVEGAEGLSADGVEEAARFLATEKNEVIRELECRIESETDTEARFVAKAGRYRLHVNTDTGEVHEVMLDTAIRGKRQPKAFKNGRPNEFWYEQGTTKAVRNAKLALIPEELVALVIENATQRGKVQRAPARVAKAPPQPPKGETRPADVRAVPEAVTKAVTDKWMGEFEGDAQKMGKFLVANGFHQVVVAKGGETLIELERLDASRHADLIAVCQESA